MLYRSMLMCCLAAAAQTNMVVPASLHECSIAVSDVFLFCIIKTAGFYRLFYLRY